MSKMRDLIIEDAFGFLKELETQEKDGRHYIISEGVPITIVHLLTQEEFVKDWLVPFAVGNDLGINYFPIGKWLEISTGGSGNVGVVDKDGKLDFVIPPVLANKLTVEEYQLLKKLNLAVSNIQQDQIQKNNPMATAGLSNAVTEKLSEIPRMLYSDMIPERIFKRYGIDPNFEKSIYYVKDILNEGNIEKEELEAFRKFLYETQSEEPIRKPTEEEKQLVQRITKGEYILQEPTEVKTKVIKEKEEEDSEFDPFGC